MHNIINNIMEKARIFYFDHGSDSVYLFDPDIFMEFWKSEYLNNKAIFQIIRGICNKQICIHKTTFYELFERLKTSTDLEPDEKIKMTTELEKIQMEIKEGDFVVVDEEKLHYYYYFDGYNFMKASGDDGRYIPELAFKFVESHGTKYFEDLPYDPWIKVPKSVKVLKVPNDDVEEAITIDEPFAIQVNSNADEDDHKGYYLINDRKYFF